MNISGEIGQRIGLLGGTFDPIHNGHLAAAATVRDVLPLDSVLFIPALHPPHKQGRKILGFEQRLAMLNLAIKGRAGMFVSRIEAERPGLSFSIDTLRRLHEKIGLGVQLFFLIGLDAFAEVHTWKEYERLPGLADFVLIDRYMHEQGRAAEMIRRYYPGYEFAQGLKAWGSETAPGMIYQVDMIPVPVSSTGIRKLLREGRSISGLVPVEVEEYIKEHHLYA